MFKGIISLFLIVGAGVVFFTETKSYFPEIKELRGQVFAYNKTIDTIKSIKSSIDKLLGEYNSISQENVDKINKIVPSDPESMKLIVQIEDTMKRNGLNLKSIETKESAKESSVKAKSGEGKAVSPLVLSMRAQGSYQAFYSFIDEMGKSLRLMDVTSVKISPAGDNSDGYSFSVEAISYWRETGDKI